jgi:hypothetical protein
MMNPTDFKAVIKFPGDGVSTSSEHSFSNAHPTIANPVTAFPSALSP